MKKLRLVVVICKDSVGSTGENYGKKHPLFGRIDQIQYIVLGVTSLQPRLVESVDYGL